jgi:hypothetical protein
MNYTFVYVLIYALAFLSGLRFITENYPVIQCYVKYRKINSVRYTLILFDKVVVHDSEYLLFENEDVKFLIFISALNSVLKVHMRF